MARIDPYKNFSFLVEIDGIERAGFSECSGLGSSVEVVQYREGGDASTVRKLIGKATYPDIVLRWGTTDTRELYDWHLSALSGLADRRNGSIILLDVNGQEEKMRWNFFQAWPSQWEGPSFDANADDVAIQSLTLSCERVEQA